MHAPKVTAILLNYNGSDDTIACYESLLQTNYPSLNFVIVDNLSPDGSFEKMDASLQAMGADFKRFDNVDMAMASDSAQHQTTLIQAGSNKGYGHGNNIGIRYALKHGADYLLVINNDTIITPDFLEPLVKGCEEDSRIGIAGGKIYFFDKPETIWFAGGEFSPLTGNVMHFHYNQIDTAQQIPQPTTFLTGCLWLVPAKTFNTVGLINEDYFMYVEDLEFCFRVINKGFTLNVVKESKIYHKVSASTGGDQSEFSIYWTARNKIKFISSNLPMPYKLTALLYTTIIASLRWLYKRQFNLFKSHIKGIIHGIIGK